MTLMLSFVLLVPYFQESFVHAMFILFLRVLEYSIQSLKIFSWSVANGFNFVWAESQHFLRLEAISVLSLKNAFLQVFSYDSINRK